jgi:hypothetical protein
VGKHAQLIWGAYDFVEDGKDDFSRGTFLMNGVALENIRAALNITEPMPTSDRAGEGIMVRWNGIDPVNYTADDWFEAIILSELPSGDCLVRLDDEEDRVSIAVVHRDEMRPLS